MNVHSMLRSSRVRVMDSRVATGVLMLWACFGVPLTSWAAQISPSSVSFSATQGGANPQPQTVGFSKLGSKKSNWSASASVGWMSLTPASGTISTETDTITIGANTAGFLPGTYSATVTIVMKGDVSQRYTMLPVTVTVMPTATTVSTPVLALSPSGLYFSAIAGGANPAAQAIGVTNSGTGTFTWTASDNATWLSLNPTSGTNAGSISAMPNTAGLAPGTYTATVTVVATGSTTKTLPVTLTLTAASTGSATLSWTANSEPDLAGYKVYMGMQSGVYGTPITLGTVTTYQILNLPPGSTYFFTITAFDSDGNESLPSAEISKSIY